MVVSFEGKRNVILYRWREISLTFTPLPPQALSGISPHLGATTESGIALCCLPSLCSLGTTLAPFSRPDPSDPELTHERYDGLTRIISIFTSAPKAFESVEFENLKRKPLRW